MSDAMPSTRVPADKHCLLTEAKRALRRCREVLLQWLITKLVLCGPEITLEKELWSSYRERLQWLVRSLSFESGDARAWAARVLLGHLAGSLRAETLLPQTLPADRRHRVLRILLRMSKERPGAALDRLLCADIDDIITSARLAGTASESGVCVWLSRSQLAFRRLEGALCFSSRYRRFSAHQPGRATAAGSGHGQAFVCYCLVVCHVLSGRLGGFEAAHVLCGSGREAFRKILLEPLLQTLLQTLHGTLGAQLMEVSKTGGVGFQRHTVWLMIQLASALKFVAGCSREKVRREDCERLIALCGLWLHEPDARAPGTDNSSLVFLPLVVELTATAQCLAWGMPRQGEQRPGALYPEMLASDAVRAGCKVIRPMWEAYGELHQGTDLQSIGLMLYRSAVVASVHGGGVVHRVLVCWLKSLWVSVNHCVQLGQNADDFMRELTDTLDVLVLQIRLHSQVSMSDEVHGDSMTARILLLEARIGLHAQGYWEEMLIRTLGGDTVLPQALSVHEMLAAGLHLLPQPGRLLENLREAGGQADIAASGYAPHTRDLLDEALIELRMLAEGARVLGVPKVESLARVMTHGYQALLMDPALLTEPGTWQLLVRAHRRLCFMLDQAAAWQPVEGSADILDRLCVWMDQRVDGIAHGNFPETALKQERSIAEEAQAWQDCRRYNQRLRSLLKRSDDLEQARVLLLELLRGQSAVIRRYLSYERHR